MLRLFTSRWTLTIALLAIAAVLVILLAPGFDLEPSAGRAARAAALAMLSMMMAAHLMFGLIGWPESLLDLDSAFYAIPAPASSLSLRC